MAETASNPFASPDIEEADSATFRQFQSKSMGRWIGLSTLSGVLLFAAYFVGVMAVCFLATVFLLTPDRMSDLRGMSVILGIYCAAGAIYGVLIGLVVGLIFGIITYSAPTGRGFLTLLVFGLPFAVLLSVVAPFLVLLSVWRASPSHDVLIFVAWTIALGIMALIAAGHLTWNIQRFLVKPNVLSQLKD